MCYMDRELHFKNLMSGCSRHTSTCRYKSGEPPTLGFVDDYPTPTKWGNEFILQFKLSSVPYFMLFYFSVSACFTMCCLNNFLPSQNSTTLFKSPELNPQHQTAWNQTVLRVSQSEEADLSGRGPADGAAPTETCNPPVITAWMHIQTNTAKFTDHALK